ncbi:LicD family protein [Thiomicrospira cyclica]|uniref:LicD family protein n=1 Tax=Thiomicrospira cyclica (strain DSM 14477 / JCM 11371 / ALM1) TaxID=717773 RepID=F6DCV9_THICA|nr:LicD family protein [Thiomicrospira cyclica]AEG31695.1 LicD family protein [Thiomicrospira cyclica ALM1]
MKISLIPLIFIAILFAKIRFWKVALGLMKGYLKFDKQPQSKHYYRTSIYAKKAEELDYAIDMIKKALAHNPRKKSYLIKLKALLKQKKITKYELNLVLKELSKLAVPRRKRQYIKRDFFESAINPAASFTIKDWNSFDIKLFIKKTGTRYQLKFKLVGDESHMLNDAAQLLVNETQVASMPIKSSVGNNGQKEHTFYFYLSEELLKSLPSLGLTAIQLNGQRLNLNSWLESLVEAKTNKNIQQALEQGYLLNKKGRLVKPKNENQYWINSTLEHYTRARKIFNQEFGLDLYVVGGTLLGFARSGGVIGFDKDFDSGYISKYSDVNKIHDEYKHIILTLLKLGEDIRLVTKVGKKIRSDYFMWFDHTGHHIDIFPAAFIDGFYKRPTFVDTKLTPEDFYPMRKESFHGHSILVPKNYTKKVESVYGANWKTPDPFWKKIKSPAIIEYRKTLMLTPQDLLEIADYSEREGEFIKQAILSGGYQVQY